MGGRHVYRVGNHHFENLGGANSVLRSCADEPLYRNGQQDLEGGNLTVWYQSCTMDLCNNAPSFPIGIQ